MEQTPGDIVLIYATYPDRESAGRTANMLITQRLAACVNIYAPCVSIYPWEGKLETSAEIPVVIKTRAELADAVIEKAEADHPYDTPCFLKIPVAGGAARYLAWLAAQTAPETTEA